MTKLDEAGLAAARKEADGLGMDLLADPGAPFLRGILTAYLDATRTSDALRDLQRLRQECEGDRIVVVVDADGYGQSAVLREPYADMDWTWRHLERLHGGPGPFRRQIVTVHGGLLRPEPVGEVVGRVEG